MKTESIPAVIVWTLTAAALVTWIAYAGLTTPIVTLSNEAYQKADYLSDEHASNAELIAASCVKVEPASAGHCGKLPKKYGITWSK